MAASALRTRGVQSPGPAIPYTPASRSVQSGALEADMKSGPCNPQTPCWARLRATLMWM